MNEAVILAILASIAPTIAALGAIIIGIVNGGKLTEIHTLTNSNLTKVTGSLEVANARILSLEMLIEKLVDGKNKPDGRSSK